MVSGTSIQVRLTRSQKERALLAMQNSGHKTMSNYVRSIILEHDLHSQNRIKEIHEKIMHDNWAQVLLEGVEKELARRGLDDKESPKETDLGVLEKLGWKKKV